MSLTTTPRAKRFFAGLAALGWLIPSSHAAAISKRASNTLVDPLPESATAYDLKWQPVMDFDDDSCYNRRALADSYPFNCEDTPMIGPDGTLAKGLPPGTDTTSYCRAPEDLDNSNAYARQRCNSGWCATVYDYYWKKDSTGALGSGHRHDIEHVVIWTQGDSLKWVSVSAHGGYTSKPAEDLYLEGNHVKVVYHKDGASTHAIRFPVGPNDANNPENAKHVWIRSALVSYNGFPSVELRDSALNNDWGDANVAISDEAFANNLENAMPMITECIFNGDSCAERPAFDFDFNRDEGSPGTPGTTPVPSNMKVMVVGDSITHGEEGDFTWRYRMWQWFKDLTKVNVDFVGPYSGTQPLGRPSPPQPPRIYGEPQPDNSQPRTSGGYHQGIDAGFDSDHFAVWGRQVAQDAPLIRQRVEEFQPDMLLVMLGFNDMGWFVSDAQGTLQSMEKFINEARLGNPNLKFALANVPQRSFIGGREDLVQKTTQYNNEFPALVQRLSTSASPIELVDVAGNYQCNPDSCPAGYDGLHPNAWGEYLIAQAFSRTLKDRYGIGSAYISVPDRNAPELQRNVAIPRNIKATPAPMGVVVTWDRVHGVYSYGVRNRIRGAAEWQVAGAGANRFDQTWTVKGIEWEFQIRSQYGDVKNGGAVGAWSGSYFATADRSTPEAPQDITTRPTANGMEVSWGAVPGNPPIDRFGVIIWDKDTPGAFTNTVGTRSSPMVFNDLIPGHRYAVWVESWGGVGLGGLAGGGPNTIVGSGRPSRPTNLQAKNQDPTTVNLTWNAVNGAASYKVYVNANEAAGGNTDEKGTLLDTNSYGIAYMFPGTWNYEICVSAINGGLESGRTCVVPPKADGF